VFLELVTMAAPRIVHRALLISLIRIGRRRILCVPVSIAFLIRILIGSHFGLLAAASWPVAEAATAVPEPPQPIALDLDLL
jgi:hypothetical protein